MGKSNKPPLLKRLKSSPANRGRNVFLPTGLQSVNSLLNSKYYFNKTDLAQWFEQ